MKNELKLTPMQQEKISRFLSAQLETLKREDRIGRLHLNNDESIVLTIKIIRAMAETIWE